MNPHFSAASQRRLAMAHPELQRLMNLARSQIAFEIDDSQRGRAAQELAFRTGHSKAHFGESAHNWSPAIAVDIHPIPLPPDWPPKLFLALHDVIGQWDPDTKFGSGLAKQLLIPITWGGDWNGNGSQTDQTLHDLPHYELRPWRQWAKACVPFGG